MDKVIFPYFSLLTNPDPKEVKKPKLSFWQIGNMSFGFLGIQFGFALFSMWIYIPPAVTSHLCHIVDTTTLAFSNGDKLVSGMFGCYA